MNPMKLFVNLYNALQSISEDGRLNCDLCRSHEAQARKAIREADSEMAGEEDPHFPAPPQQGSLIRTMGLGEGMMVGAIEIRVIKKMGRKLQVAVAAPREIVIKRLYGTEV